MLSEQTAKESESEKPNPNKEHARRCALFESAPNAECVGALRHDTRSPSRPSFKYEKRKKNEYALLHFPPLLESRLEVLTKHRAISRRRRRGETLFTITASHLGSIESRTPIDSSRIPSILDPGKQRAVFCLKDSFSRLA